jgi:hypothetical protein
VWLLNEFARGDRLRLQICSIPEEFVDKPYGAVLEHFVEVRELTPVGLLRDDRHANAVLHYVQTSPDLDELVRRGDLLYVVAPKAKYPLVAKRAAVPPGVAAVNSH